MVLGDADDESIILGQMISLDMIFHVVVSVYRLVKIWKSPQSPVEFRNGLLLKLKTEGQTTQTENLIEKLQQWNQNSR